MLLLIEEHIKDLLQSTNWSSAVVLRPADCFFFLLFFRYVFYISGRIILFNSILSSKYTLDQQWLQQNGDYIRKMKVKCRNTKFLSLHCCALPILFIDFLFRHYFNICVYQMRMTTTTDGCKRCLFCRSFITRNIKI